MVEFFTLTDTLISVGSHCQDILKAHETDPEWLVTQRKTEVGIVKVGSASIMQIWKSTNNRNHTQR